MGWLLEFVPSSGALAGTEAPFTFATVAFGKVPDKSPPAVEEIVAAVPSVTGVPKPPAPLLVRAWPLAPLVAAA
jgi:hypothetical protein